MAKLRNKLNEKGLLEAALEGLELQRQRLDQQIAEVKARLGRPKVGRPAGSTKAKAKKRTLSAAARKRIALAQKKRWAAYHKKKGSGS